jgi:chitinase
MVKKGGVKLGAYHSFLFTLLFTSLLLTPFISVAQADDKPPWLSPIDLSPLDYDEITVSGNVQIRVTAKNDIGVGKVEFYSDEGKNLIGTKTSPPYSVNWSTSPRVPDGEQVLTAIAYDTSGQTTKVSRTVYVQNNRTPPSTPTGFRVTGKTDRTISLAWDATKDNIGVVEYEIYDGLIRIGTSVSNSVTLNELKPGKAYHLTVKARDRAWNFSAASRVLAVSTEKSRDHIPPSAPVNLTVISSTDTTIKLEWYPSKDNYDPVSTKTYNIYDGSTLIGTSSVPQATLTGLKPNTAFMLTVKAKDEAGNLSYSSNPVTGYTGPLDKSAPAAPLRLRSPKKTDTTISLKWNDPSYQYGVTIYEVYQNQVKVVETTSPNFVAGGLQPNTLYSFYVTAKDAKGQVSPASNRLILTTGSTMPALQRPMIIAYYAGWATHSRSEVYDIDASKLTHLNYAFADIGDDLKIKVGDPFVDTQKIFPGDSDAYPFNGNFNQLEKLKQKHPHLKTIISVGGWTWSQKFSEVALTEASRTVFANSVVKFLVTYGFDGVDLDWEYPVRGGEKKNVCRSVDKKNYTLLLQKIREKLDERERIDGKTYSLSIAAGASPDFAENTQLVEIAKYVDYIQLMTYDFNGPLNGLTGFNAPLLPVDHSWSVSQTVNLFLNKGVPASKLVMGFPFYGYRYKGVNPTNNGLYQSYNGAMISTSFGELEKDFINKKDFVRHWHAKSKVPYLWNGSTFISYDDAKSLAHKAKYLRTKKLAGAMIWDISQDPNEVLLDQLFSDLGGN